MNEFPACESHMARWFDCRRRSLDLFLDRTQAVERAPVILGNPPQRLRQRTLSNFSPAVSTRSVQEKPIAAASNRRDASPGPFVVTFEDLDQPGRANAVCQTLGAMGPVASGAIPTLDEIATSAEDQGLRAAAQAALRAIRR